MARIRTIKPEFWQDEKLAPLSPLERLVFLGLISQADDAGRLVDNVKSIDGFIFPETEDTCRDALATLARTSRILRYVAESGQKLIQIRNWERHQKVAHPSPYVLPAPTAEQLAAPAVTESSRNSHESLAKGSCSDQLPTINDPRSPINEYDRVGADAPRMLAIVPTGAIAVADVGRPAPVARAVAGALETVRDATTRRRAREDERKVAAACVFEYVAHRLGYPKNTRYDEKREARILARLTENKGDVGELLAVADGALKDPWIMGKDPKSPRPYTGIETLYRDRAQVERLAALAKYDPDGPPHPFLADVEARLAEEADHVA